MLIKEVRLGATHLSSLYDFYKDCLELPVVQFKNSIIITAGQSRLVFEETPREDTPFYHFAFNIPSNKFKEALKWMQGKASLLWLQDYKSYAADFVNWHAKSFYFKDPSGNILEMIGRFDLQDNVYTSFFSKHIRNISEIGIVLPKESFDKEVDGLMNAFSLTYFDKQPPLPYFRAIGDDHGLFVVVPENRSWFPTENNPAKIFPMKISFIKNGEPSILKMGIF